MSEIRVFIYKNRKILLLLLTIMIAVVGVSNPDLLDVLTSVQTAVESNSIIVEATQTAIAGVG